MTNETLRNGITTIEAIRALNLDTCYIVVKNQKDQELDRYWYKKDCDTAARYKRDTDTMKVVDITIEQHISLIRFSTDPRITIIVK